MRRRAGAIGVITPVGGLDRRAAPVALQHGQVRRIRVHSRAAFGAGWLGGVGDHCGSWADADRLPHPGPVRRRPCPGVRLVRHRRVAAGAVSGRRAGRRADRTGRPHRSVRPNPHAIGVGGAPGGRPVPAAHRRSARHHRAAAPLGPGGPDHTTVEGWQAAGGSPPRPTLGGRLTTWERTASRRFNELNASDAAIGYLIGASLRRRGAWPGRRCRRCPVGRCRPC